MTSLVGIQANHGRENKGGKKNPSVSSGGSDHDNIRKDRIMVMECERFARQCSYNMVATQIVLHPVEHVRDKK